MTFTQSLLRFLVAFPMLKKCAWGRILVWVAREHRPTVVIPLAFSACNFYSLRMDVTDSFLKHPDTFVRRHIGPNESEARTMLGLFGFKNLDDLANAAVPQAIRLDKKLDLPAAKSESEALAELKKIASENEVFRSFIGMGYYDCITPPVIQRNVLENPGWYTQ